MGRIILRQDNGLFAIWSSVVDNFIHLNCTDEEVFEVFIQEAVDLQRSSVTDLMGLVAKNGTSSRQRPELLIDGLLDRIKEIHGQEEYAAVLDTLAASSPETRTPGGHLLAHDDHGLEPCHLAFIDTTLEGWDGSFLMVHLDMPEECTPLLSALYGPAAGDAAVGEDEVEYEKRGTRPGPSRLVERPHRPVQMMVLIAGPGNDGPIIYTAYGSPVQAPREWWDSGMKPLEAMAAAKFWSEHALAK
jgi:hypothetical protein